MSFISLLRQSRILNWCQLLDALRPGSRVSFSQSGEDLILKYLFDALGVCAGTYVDIGANDPIRYNNTFIFYRSGWKGYCVEPQLNLCLQLKKTRPKDQIVKKGIAVEDGILKFYRMEPDTLSTFSRDVADRYVRVGHTLSGIEEVPVVSVRNFLGENPEAKKLDLLSIDIEGDEARIVTEFVAQGARPKVVVCETRAYSPDLKGCRETEKIESIRKLGYEVYADTFINTIFLDGALR